MHGFFFFFNSELKENKKNLEKKKKKKHSFPFPASPESKQNKGPKSNPCNFEREWVSEPVTLALDLAGLDRDAESRGASPEWWWSVGVTVELGCSDSFTPLKPRSRKKGRLRSGLGLRHLRDEPLWNGGHWWSERSLSCWPWRGLERAHAEIEETESSVLEWERGLGEVYCGGLGLDHCLWWR